MKKQVLLISYDLHRSEVVDKMMNEARMSYEEFTKDRKLFESFINERARREYNYDQIEDVIIRNSLASIKILRSEWLVYTDKTSDEWMKLLEPVLQNQDEYFILDVPNVFFNTDPYRLNMEARIFIERYVKTQS